MKTAPKYLYRYRSFIADTNAHLPERGLEEITQAKSNKTWFSKVGSQNDPFDTNPNYQDSLQKDVREFLSEFHKVAGPRASFASDDFVADAKARGLRKSDAKKLLHNYRLLIKTTRQTFFSYRENSLISCFSTEVANILMWSYYGNSHSSYCFRFKLNEGDNGSLAVADVRYLDDRPQLSTVDMMRRMAAARRPEKFDYDDQENERVDNATLLSKSSDWRHENEWRALKTPDYKPGYYSIAPYKFDGVVLGANVSEETETALKDIFGSEQLSRCKLSSSHYKIEITE